MTLNLKNPHKPKIRFRSHFAESSWKPVVRSQQGYQRPALHLVDSPSFDEMSQNYPTYKLDRNSVVDTSIRWERYSYPSSRNPSSNHPSGSYPSGNYPSITSVPPPPPPPPLPRSQSNQSQSKIMGTRLWALNFKPLLNIQRKTFFGLKSLSLNS
jgi:hypothetical protein